MKRKSISIYIYMMLAGILLIALDMGINLGTGISYGFVFGENEGVSAFAMTNIVTLFVGTEMSAELFMRIAGYGIIILTLFLLKKTPFNRNTMNVRAVFMAVVGLAAAILERLLPFALPPEKMALTVVILYLLQVLAAVVIMFSFIYMCTWKIDNYKYMHVKKDLSFAAELYGVCMVTGRILKLLHRAQVYFAGILYWIVIGCEIFALIYFTVKTWLYMRATDEFGYLNDRQQ